MSELIAENVSIYQPTVSEIDQKKPPGVYRCPECKDAVIAWRTPVDKFKVKCPKCNADMVRSGPVPKLAVETFEEAKRIATEATEKYLVGKRISPQLKRRLLKIVGTGAAVGGGIGLGAGVHKSLAETPFKEQLKPLSIKRHRRITELRHEKKRKENAALLAQLKREGYSELDELAKIYGKDPLRARLEAANAGVPLSTVAFHYGKGTALTGLQLGMQHGLEESTGTRGAPSAIKLWLLQKLHGSSYIIGRQQGLGGKHGGTRSAVSETDILPELLEGLTHGQA